MKGKKLLKKLGKGFVNFVKQQYRNQLFKQLIGEEEYSRLVTAVKLGLITPEEARAYVRRKVLGGSRRPRKRRKKRSKSGKSSYGSYNYLLR